ncbi:MAG: nuclear transport factor 2 family protein [Novosphingobium sp.]
MTADTLIARHQILNALAVHSRGVDRADVNLLGSAYHPDATVDYGFYVGPAAALVDMLGNGQKGTLPTLHRTANTEIRIQGDHAVAESYVIAYVEEPEIQRMVFGRYLDTLECRDGSWRLSNRTYVLDSNTNRPNTAMRADPPVANDHFVPDGGKGAADAGRVLIAHHEASSRTLQKASPMTPDSAALDAALSRDAIRALVTGYCRAADRADAELMASLFWEDANVISGIVNGTGADFATAVTAHILANLDSCFHSVANEWIEVRGDHAVGEHYILAHNRAGGQDALTGGRYVDSYERRDGVWKIASRTFVCDWTSTHPTTYEAAGFYQGLTTRGIFGREDPVYQHWASL